MIASRNPQDHSEHLRQVLQRMRENAITLKFTKCNTSHQETGKLPEDEKKAKYIALQRELFLLEDGVLYYIGISKKKSGEMLQHPKLIVVPASLKTLVLECHNAPSSGHLHFKRTLARVEAKYYWEGIYSEVKRHCNNCQACYRKKLSRTKTQGEIELTVEHHQPRFHRSNENHSKTK